MKLLELEDDQLRAVPTAECMEIGAFRDLIDRDDSESQLTAVRELAYVFHMVDVQSPYAEMEESLRREQVKSDLRFEEDWTPDEKMKTAEVTYREITQSAAAQLLQSALKSVHKLKRYFAKADPLVTDDRGKAVWSAKDIVSNLSKIGDVIKGLNGLKKEVDKEQISDAKNRAGVKTNKYSR